MIDLQNDEQVFAATLDGEARGEHAYGEDGVAIVIMNRFRFAHLHPRRQFGTGTIASTCLAPWQFSSWNQNDVNRARLLALDFVNPPAELAQCVAIARAAMADTLADPTGGKLTDPTQPATFYKVTTLPWPHDWGAIVPALAVIEHQSFYHLP